MAKMNMNAAMDHRISNEISHFGNAWFDKERITAKVLASYGKMPGVKGLDLGKVVHAYVKHRVTAYLQQHDANGWRVFEAYRAGSDWRWQRARAMDAPTLLNVIDERRAQLDKDQKALDRLVRLYDAMIAFEKANNKSAVVDDVIATVA